MKTFSYKIQLKKTTYAVFVMSSANPFNIDHPKSMLEEILGYSLHPNVIYGFPGPSVFIWEIYPGRGQKASPFRRRQGLQQCLRWGIWNVLWDTWPFSGLKILARWWWEMSNGLWSWLTRGFTVPLRGAWRSDWRKWHLRLVRHSLNLPFFPSTP